MPDELTRDEIEELKRLEKSAHAAPWWPRWGGEPGYIYASGPAEVVAVLKHVSEDDQDDANFIAAARNALPKLLAMLEKREAEAHAGRWRTVADERPALNTGVLVAIPRLGEPGIKHDVAELDADGCWYFADPLLGERPAQPSDAWQPLTPPAGVAGE